MTPGPWTIGRLMGGFCVKNPNQTIVAEMRGSQLPFGEHRVNAEVISRLPELIETLVTAESYFGDLPSSDRAAMRIHRRITRALNAVGVDPSVGAADPKSFDAA
jgi:hypothetical protein